MTKQSEVVAAITSKEVFSKCECCGHEKWLVPNTGDASEEALSLGMLVAMGLGNGVEFTPMICLNCGNTRFLHTETLMRKADV